VDSLPNPLSMTKHMHNQPCPNATEQTMLLLYPVPYTVKLNADQIESTPINHRIRIKIAHSYRIYKIFVPQMSHTNSENKPYGSSIPFQLSNDQDPSSFGISPSDINMTFWSNGSSFSSSASGSGAGGSFSSVDNLPSISRDFVRPSDNDTRRPATAGGALQQPSRTMFTSGLEATIQEEDGNENDHSGGNSRRASVPHDSWLNHGTSMPSITPYNQFVMTQQHAQGNPARNTNQVLRPQTSDGLPHHTMVPSLPSLNSHVQYTGTMAPRTIPNAIPNMGYSSFPGDRTFSFAGVQPQFVNGNVDGPSSYPGMDARKHTFVAADEDRPKAKRPRRRADEITRKYKCGWNGCDKGYGTLNHLNAHVETLKHGEKRTSDGEYNIYQGSSNGLD
jgi:hypothetical protein